MKDDGANMQHGRTKYSAVDIDDGPYGHPVNADPRVIKVLRISD